MPQVEVAIGGRTFEVACQEGEEHFLQSAALMLDSEASHLSSQIGRMPEARMLLMSGLMLADKTAGLEEKLRDAEERMATMQAQIEQLQSRDPERVEVPIISPEVVDTFAEIAARAESLADQVDAQAS